MTIIDLEKLKTGTQNGPLSDEAQDQIQRQAAAEIAAEEAARANGGKAPEEKKVETNDRQEPVKKDEKPNEAEAAAAKPKTEEEKAAEKAAEQKRVDEAILLKKDEELTAEEKTRKGEIQKAHEEAFNAKVKEYAAKEKITEEEARKDLESEKKILEKYKAEPEKLARTVLSTQRAYTRLQNEIKAEKERAASAIGENEIVIQGKKYTFDDAREQMIELFRDGNPKETEQLDDDTVFEKAKESWKGMVKAKRAEYQAEVAKTAAAKKSELLAGIPESAKPYKGFIEEALKHAPDERVLQDDYDLTDIVLWARGQYYTDEKLKELEEAGFRRGQERAKILGEKNEGGRAASGSGGQPSNKPAEKVNPSEEVASLTDDQKQRALSMFQGIDHWNEDRKYLEYVDHLKSVGEWKPAKK